MSDIPPPPQHFSGYSNYPRAQFTPVPPDRPPGVYFDYIGKAWNMVNTNLGTWILATLILFGITYGVNIPLSLLGNFVAYGSPLGMGFSGAGQPGAGQTFPSMTQIGISFGFTFLSVFISYPLQAGMLNMALKQVRGLQVSPGDVFSGYSRAGHVVISYLLMGLLCGIAICLCIIPSFYAFGVLAFTPLLVVDRNLTGMEAITQSYNSLKPYAWSMFGFLFVLGLLNMLGGCACGVGMLFSFPVYVMAQAMTYHNFFPYPLETEGFNSQIGLNPNPYGG